VNEAEVAPEVLELVEVSDTGDPTDVPEVQGWVDVVGPHSVKVTVPVGAPAVALPVTVAVSVTVPLDPMTREPSPGPLADCWAAVLDGVVPAVKHSLRSAVVPVLSLEPE
jgi:hypothetical protein